MSPSQLTIGQMIGLNLMRLYIWLVQMNAAGQTDAPRDIVLMVIKTDALVQAYIRSRAMVQLEAAGYFQAANAMRVPPSMRTSPLDTPLLAVAPEEVAQVTPSDLLTRVEAMIDQFEQADVIDAALARIIVCTLFYAAPETQSAPPFSARFNIRPDVGRSTRRAALNPFYTRRASRAQRHKAVSKVNWRDFNILRRVGLGPQRSIARVSRGQPYRGPPPAGAKPVLLSPTIPVKTSIHASIRTPDSLLVHRHGSQIKSGIGRRKFCASPQNFHHPHTLQRNLCGDKRASFFEVFTLIPAKAGISTWTGPVPRLHSRLFGSHNEHGEGAASLSGTRSTACEHNKFMPPAL